MRDGDGKLTSFGASEVMDGVTVVGSIVKSVGWRLGRHARSVPTALRDLEGNLNEKARERDTGGFEILAGEEQFMEQTRGGGRKAGEQTAIPKMSRILLQLRAALTLRVFYSSAAPNPELPRCH